MWIPKELSSLNYEALVAHQQEVLQEVKEILQEVRTLEKDVRENLANIVLANQELLNMSEEEKEELLRMLITFVEERTEEVG